MQTICYLSTMELELFKRKEVLPLKNIQMEKGIKKALMDIKACGDEWIRTTDSRIFSPMLYQLSYITSR